MSPFSPKTSMRSLFEKYLKAEVLSLCPKSIPVLNQMIEYHFGWDTKNPVAGKRLRPMIILLTCAAFVNNFEIGLPASAAIEVLHNFTLIHDDIEDQGDLRHGKPALWTKYGIPQTINTGDYLASISMILFERTEKYVSSQNLNQARKLFQTIHHEVIQGQHLDMLYETKFNVSPDDYLDMIRLKTSRLFSGAFMIAGALSDLKSEKMNALDDLGRFLGLGFQIQDDYLGIWGKANETGKSNLTDLLTKKKTFPVLHGLNKSTEFSKIWVEQTEISAVTSQTLKSILEENSIRDLTLQEVKLYKNKANKLFKELFDRNNIYTSALEELISSMTSSALI